MLRKQIFLIAAFVGFLNFCISQEYKFHHITTIDGLSHNEVRKIVKDTEGFMWFGTQNGLNRFDGYRIKVFKHHPNDSTTLKADKIYALATSKDKLWIGTTNGISIMDTRTLTIVPSPKISALLKGMTVLKLSNDEDGRIWVSTEGKNFLIDTKTLDIQAFMDPYRIVSVAKSLNGDYWIGTDQGLIKYDMGRSAIIKNYDIGRFSIYDLNQVYTNSNGEIWATVGDELYRYQSERDRFVLEHCSKALNFIAENEEGTMFFGSYGEGLLKYDRVTGLFTEIHADHGRSHTLSSDDVYDVYVDDENILWVGTQEGLDYYDYTRHRFNSLVHNPGKGKGLRSSFVQSLCGISKDTLWVGTREGIDQVVLGDGYSDIKIAPVEAVEQKLAELKDKYISFIFKDSRNRIWIGTQFRGLYMYERATKSLQHFGHTEDDPQSLIYNGALSAFEDDQGRIWFGSNGGLSLLMENGKGGYAFENFTHSDFNGEQFSLKHIHAIFQDSKGRIWLAMNGGGIGLLHEMDGKKTFRIFLHDPSEPKSLSNNEVFVIFEDSKRQLWFGTSQGGLNLLRENGVGSLGSDYYFESFTETDGLSDNEVNAILEDGSGSLWVATNKGLTKFDAPLKKFVNYGTYDGVVKGKFRKNAMWKNADGTLFFGGAAGINFFDPDNFKYNHIFPTPKFTELIVNAKYIDPGQELDGKEVYSTSLESGSSINLPANGNNFIIRFTALSFASTYRNQYFYKLEDVDTEWHSVSGQNPYANYSSLRPGSYRLLLRASNNDDLLNEEPIYLDIKVRSNLLNSTAFIIGSILIGGVTIAFLLRKLSHVRDGRKMKKKPKLAIPDADEGSLETIASLQSLMESEKLYLDPDLGLNRLAEKIGISANHLSMLLNDHIGKNFHDYVNFYRMEEVKKRLLDPAYDNKTISSIGGDCGFNSKSAFNRIFKKSTGKTPSEFRRTESEAWEK